MEPRAWIRVGLVLALWGAAALSTLPEVRARGAKPAPSPGKRPRIEYPKLIKFVRAKYPEAARKASRQGVVRLFVTVGVDGKVAKVDVSKSSGHTDLDAAAVAAVQQFVYTPAKVNGNPTAVKIVVAYPFRLRTAPARPDPRVRRPPARRPPAARRPPPRRRTAPRPPRRPPLAKASRTELGGVVREKGTRKPLEDAQVLVFEPGAKKKQLGTRVAGTRADPKGRFKLAKLPPGKYRVVVRVPGCYSFQVDENLTPGVRLKVEYYVERRSYDPYETVITSKVERKQVSKYVVALPEIQKIPGTQGDALRAVQNMPGVARASFGGGQLVVRGSSPGDTRVFFEGIEIPQLYHFFGLTSVFNSDILKQIMFVPGNFSVRYGRATGGIIDVFTRAGKKDRWHGYVDVDIWDVGLLLEGPVGKGSIALSARRSHIDAVLKVVPKDRIGANFTLAPAYYDYQAMLDYPIWKGKFKLIFFGSDDRLKILLEDPSDFDPSARQLSNTIFFHRVITAWKRKWGDNALKVTLSGGYSLTDFYLSDALRLNLKIARFNVRTEYTRKIAESLSLSFGYVGEASWAWVDFSAPPIPLEGEIPPPIGSQEPQAQKLSGSLQNHAFFVEATWKPVSWLTLIPGARVDILHLGPLDAQVFDPRLTAKVRLHKKLVWNAGVGIFHQEPFYTQLYEMAGGNPKVSHERSMHVSTGLVWKPRPSLSIETTGFYKYLWRRVVSTDNIMNRDGEITTENLANLGRGRIYGGELLIKKHPDSDCPKGLKLQKCFGWLSYTVLRSERQDSAGDRWRLFDYDQTHILTLVLSGTWRGGWQLGVRFRLASGNPTTMFSGGIFDSDSDAYIGLPGPINADRLPLFHQLDIRLDKKFVFKKWILSIYLDVQNVYNYQASEFAIYNFNYTQHGYLSGLPIIPSLGIKGAF
jgi:TonB family protein